MKMSRWWPYLAACCVAASPAIAGVVARPNGWGWTDLRTNAAETPEVAVIDQNPEAGNCNLDETYNVVGFNQNSNDITPKLKNRLDQIVADIGDRQCRVTLTGYASHDGSLAANALFAIERAQNSLKYLRERGVKFIEASATGVGATDAFGAASELNRRVVILVSP